MVIFIIAVCFFCAVRTGIIYMLSAFSGTLVTAIFVRDSPAVCSSGALFGLLGATVSALTRNWKFYTNKVMLILFTSSTSFPFRWFWPPAYRSLLSFISGCSSADAFLCGWIQFNAWLATLHGQLFKHWQSDIRISTWTCAFLHPST